VALRSAQVSTGLMKRKPITISLSYSNQDAITVMRSLLDIPQGQRSAALLRWAALGIKGKFIDGEIDSDENALSEQEFDDMLDNL
jgi:hypothetical protein